MSTRTPLAQITSPILTVPRDHIDTDQIIPARFLTTTERSGLGDQAFADWRDDPPLNDPRANECAILVAGDNFGCGSSREHAPWALLEWGMKAVVSTSFADIFRNNAHKNGLLTVEVDPTTLAALFAAPWSEVTIDVPRRTISGAFGSTTFPIDPFAHHCLIHGIDELDWLLGHRDAITAYEEARP